MLNLPRWLSTEAVDTGKAAIETIQSIPGQIEQKIEDTKRTAEAIAAFPGKVVDGVNDAVDTGKAALDTVSRAGKAIAGAVGAAKDMVSSTFNSGEMEVELTDAERKAASIRREKLRRTAMDESPVARAARAAGAFLGRPDDE